MRGVFFTAKPYDRSDVLARADQARTKGRYRKAIKGYRKILAVDPSDMVVHGKLAPLLARQKEHRGEALASFQLAAQGHLKTGFVDRALAVYVQAAEFFPENADLWSTIAQLQTTQSKRADAANTLIKGSTHLGKNKTLRPRAIAFLESALTLIPFHLEATLDLSRLLAKEGDGERAIATLQALVAHVRGRSLRRVRWALVRLSATPSNLWHWAKACFNAR